MLPSDLRPRAVGRPSGGVTTRSKGASSSRWWQYECDDRAWRFFVSDGLRASQRSDFKNVLEWPRLDPSREKSLGIAACTAIVVGNMVGSGFYLSPSAIAPYGTLAIVVWVLMGAGAICLGLTFAKLARLRPETGGPYAYTRIAYGDFPGFLIAWVYWISIWASLPVIAVAFAGAIIDMFPGLHSRIMATVLTLAAHLGRGAHQSARRQGGRPLCRTDDLFENGTVRGDRDHWVVLHRSDAFQ